MRFKDGVTIRFCIDEPEYTDLPGQLPQWDTFIYRGDVSEENNKPTSDFSKPLCKHVVLTQEVDAILYHGWITERSVTGVLSLISQQTPIDCYYGFEFVPSSIGVPL
jgi:hypothetical protein